MHKHINIPTLVLFSFSIKTLITGLTPSDSFVMVGLCALYGFWYFLESKKEPIINKAIVDRVVELEEQLRVTREKVNAINLGSSLKR